jgi:hypothetical protein
MPNKVKDITGEKFGKLTVLKRDGYTNGKRKSILWLCKCDCGNEVKRTSAHLKQNNASSTCGKCRLINDSDYLGKTFGYWTILSVAKSNSRKKSYICKCICGNEKVVALDTLKLGTSKSCGCFHKEQLSKKLTTHGQTGKRIMTIYYNIKNRCYCENNNRFKDYGGRGIRMCDEWKNNSSLFVKWSLENGYAENMTIDRINNDGDYCPENCRWISMKEQAQNKRTSITFTFYGVTKNLKEWCDCIEENYKKMYGRYHRGYKVFREEDVLKIKRYLENGGS